MKAQVYYITAMLIFAQYGISALWGEVLPMPILAVVGSFFIIISLIQSYRINTIEIIIVKYFIGITYFYYGLMIALRSFIFFTREFGFFNPYIMGTGMFFATFGLMQIYFFVNELKSYHQYLGTDQNRSQKTFIILPVLAMTNLYLYIPIFPWFVWGVVALVLLSLSVLSIKKDSRFKIVKDFKYFITIFYIVGIGLYYLVFSADLDLPFLYLGLNYTHVFLMIPLSVFMLMFAWQYERGKITPYQLKPRSYERTTLDKARNINEILPPRRRRYR